jgi:hypothetical protein
MAKQKYISSPARMWKLFTEYKAHVKANPVMVEDYVGKDADRVMREKEAPLTMEGFEIFVADKPGMPESLERYFANSNNDYKEFLTICSRIRKEIRADQIKGGMVGIYNPSITQRLNGLVDKTESKFDVDVKQITGVVVK